MVFFILIYMYILIDEEDIEKRYSPYFIYYFLYLCGVLGYFRINVWGISKEY